MPDIKLALLFDRFMRRINADVQANATDFERENFGAGGGIVLMTLDEMGEVEMHELAKRVSRDKSQVTRTVQALEDRGLVLRQPSPLDARAKRVSLTKAGQAAVSKHKDTVGATINAILQPIGEDEKAALTNVLQRILRDTQP